MNVHNQILDSHSQDISIINESISNLEAALNHTKILLKDIQIDNFSLRQSVATVHFTSLVHTAFVSMSTHVSNLKRALLASLKGSLDPYLLPRDKLLALLQNIYHRGKELLFPVTTDYLSLWYDVIKVIPRSVEDGVILYIQIPLAGDPEMIFDLFKTTPIPIPTGEGFFSLLSNVKPLFAISHTRDYYKELEISDLDMFNCVKHNHLYVCTDIGPIFSSSTARSCLSSRFLGQDPVSNCDSVLIRTFCPQLIPVEGSFLYVTPEPFQLSVACPGQHGTRTRLQLTGSGFLVLPESCSARSDTFVVPAQSTTQGAAVTYNTAVLNSTLPDAVRSFLASAPPTPKLEILRVQARSEGEATDLLRDYELRHRIQPLEDDLSTTHLLAIAVMGGLVSFVLSHLSCVLGVVCRYWRRRDDASATAQTPAPGDDAMDLLPSPGPSLSTPQAAGTQPHQRGG